MDTCKANWQEGRVFRPHGYLAIIFGFAALFPEEISLRLVGSKVKLGSMGKPSAA